MYATVFFLFYVYYVFMPGVIRTIPRFIFFRQFGQFDYSGQGGYDQTSVPYGGVQQSGYAGTIMTPDPVNYNAEATDDFENEPPLMEGTTITKL